jgi:hypothetical protein
MVTAALVHSAARFGLDRREATLLLLLLAAPASALWTSAGLETPLLLAFVTVLATNYNRLAAGDRRGVVVVSSLAGLAVLTRLDAVLFSGPVLVASLIRARASVRLAVVAIVVACVPVASWLAWAWSAYHAILPTSFYVKRPTFDGQILVANSRYMLEHLLISGVALSGIYVGVRLLAAPRPAATLLAEVRARWGIYAGLASVLAYGATMATSHMMFAFRHFVPYLPAAGLALAQLLRRTESEGAALTRRTPGLAVVAAVILAVHLSHALVLYSRSLQGLGTTSEYTAVGVADYMDTFVSAMRRNAEATRRHWERLNPGRPPRIWTFAAGVLPYVYRDAYVFEDLVSFRHRCTRDWKVYADYVHVFTRHGRLLQQLVRLEIEELRVVSRERFRFDGKDESMLVYYNPLARNSPIPSRVDQPCRSDS